MKNIKSKLKNLVEKNVIPEIENYLEELYTLLEKKTATENDIQEMRQMESFLVELENIVLVIKEDKLTDKEANDVFIKIEALIENSHKY